MNILYKLIARVAARYHNSIQNEINTHTKNLNMIAHELKTYNTIRQLAMKHNSYSEPDDIQKLVGFILRDGIGGVQNNINHWEKALIKELQWFKDNGLPISQEYDSYLRILK